MSPDQILKLLFSVAATRDVLLKMLLLKILQSSHENTFVFLKPTTLLKKTLPHRGFLVNCAKFLITPFLQKLLATVSVLYESISLESIDYKKWLNLPDAQCLNLGVATTSVNTPTSNTKSCFILRYLQITGPDTN